MRKYFRYWHEDSFLSTNGFILKYDKLEHVILGFVGMIVSYLLFEPKGIQQFFFYWLIWNGIGVLWEIFQLLYVKTLIEIKDIAANNAGFILSLPFFL